MAVPVRRTDSGRPLEVWEPFGTEAWDPAAEMRELTERFSRLVNQLTGQWPTDGLLPGSFSPLGELEEQDDAYLVRVELPGVKQGDIEVELAGRRLTVRAERKETQRKGLLRRSTRRTGEFFFEALLPGEVVEVSFDLPGIDPDSVELTVERNLLTVKAERRLELAEDAQVITRERPQGTFTRQLYLSDAIDRDKVEAHYADGVLTLTMPVAEAAKPRRIEITTNGAKAITGTSHPAGAEAAS